MIGRSRCRPRSSAASGACVGCAKAEPQIRALLGHIAAGFSKDPYRFFGFDLSGSGSEPVNFSAAIQRWINKWESDPDFSLCPDVKMRIEGLLSRLLRVREAGAGLVWEKATEGDEEMREAGGGSMLDSGGRKRRRGEDEEEMREMLGVLRCVAVDPCDEETKAERVWRKKILEVRKVLCIKISEVSGVHDFPYQLLNSCIFG